MKRITEFLAHIGKDKYIHFAVCLVASLVLFLAGRLAGLIIIPPIAAILIPLALGVWKELRDSRSGGVFDRGDIAADFLGVFVGACLMALYAALS